MIKSKKNASAGQYPVKGIIFENLDGKGYHPYIFKDCVTVFLNPHRPTDLSSINDYNIVRKGKYARIISTTREEYNLAFPNRDTTGKKWLKIVREESKKCTII